MENKLVNPVVLFLTSYPPRPCGIATFTQDVIRSLENKFHMPYELQVCALENNSSESYDYPDRVKYKLNTDDISDCIRMADMINNKSNIAAVCLQFEFGLWDNSGMSIIYFLTMLDKPLFTVFHTVLPHPNNLQLSIIKALGKQSEKLVVMTRRSAEILGENPNISKEKIVVIPHGTHPIIWGDKEHLKIKYNLEQNLVLSTFGLLGPNKNIETTLNALPLLAKAFPNLKFLILGRTHPELVRQQGEVYRQKLEQLVVELKLSDHVIFINKYLELDELLEYLKLTDVYVFSSNDPQQAVSGTFAYAMSCGNPLVSTPIPHALEILDDNCGIFFEFENSQSLSLAIKPLLSEASLREEMGLKAYQKIRNSIWENVAVAYADLISLIIPEYPAHFKKPVVKMNHIRKMTDDVGIIQFSKITVPDKSSGYTLDDNARALVATIMHYVYTRDYEDLDYIDKYLQFILFCQEPDGRFKNYVDDKKEFHDLNNYVNLEDSNARAIWALCFVVNQRKYLPRDMVDMASGCLSKTESWLDSISSPRSIALTIKGLYYYHKVSPSAETLQVIDHLARKLMKSFIDTSSENWLWFENYLTYANSLMPEAMLYAYDVTNKEAYKKIGVTTLDFLISYQFKEDYFQFVSNRGWFHKGEKPGKYGEQPIEASYLIQTLDAFFSILGDKKYYYLMEKAFTWFLGNNHLRQTVYDAQSGGCQDGLEKENVNLNQGAESTICYLMARLITEKYEVHVGKVNITH